MASTIDATVGGASANSYVTLQEAATYFGDRLHKDAWTNASAPDKTAALIWAAKVIDSRISWLGTRASSTQARAWPRAYVRNPDPANSTADTTCCYLPADAIPQDIKDAQCEMALALLASDITATPDSAGIGSLAVSSLRIDFAGAQQPTIPRQVDELLSRYGTVRATSSTRKVVRA